MKINSLNLKETSYIATILGSEIVKTKSLVVLGLVGGLGAGKTTFTKSLIKALGSKKKVTSPTFLIMRKFVLKNKRKVYHIDAYRIAVYDLVHLGAKEIFKSPNIVIVEWADRIKKTLPKDTVWINFAYGKKENERQLTFNRR
jgi:tRNA threonylcarbamoyladenosine biosynthesis protein TsaE